MFCETCTAVTAEYGREVALKSDEAGELSWTPFSKELHDGLDSLRKSSEKGCAICRNIWHSFTDRERDRLPADVVIYIDMTVDNAMPIMRVSLRDLGQNVLQRTSISNYAGESPSETVTDVLRTCAAMENRSTGSTASFKMARFWLKQCLETHDKCPKPTTYLPTRVIDVGPADGSQDPYLYDTRTKRVDIADVERKYAALSYCWGPPPWYRTEKLSFDDRCTAIPMSDLPKTLHDAVVVTRAMGIRFLWIDALCILQDDKDDWKREAATMCTVYQKAAFTITAARADTSHGGLFATRDGIRVLPFMIEVPLADRTAYCRFTPTPRREIVWDMSELVLYQRAWVLQEMILSTRALIYDPDCVRWECLSAYGSERNVDGGIGRHHSRIRELQLGISQDKSNGRPTPPFMGDDIPIQASGWQHVVEDYMLRGITKPSDRLIAMYGVAEAVKAATEYKYLAGLWENFLPHGLAWFVYRLRRGSSVANVKVLVDKPLPFRPAETVAPSWSWASVETPVAYSTITQELSICRVVSAAVEGTPEAVTGRLIVEGHTRTMYVLSEKSSIIEEALDSVKSNKYTYDESHGFKPHLAEPDQVIFVSPHQPEMLRSKAQAVPGRWCPEEVIDAKVPITFLAIILKPYLPGMPVSQGSQKVCSIALLPTGGRNEYKRIGYAEWDDCAWFGYECGPFGGNKQDGYARMAKSWGRIKPPTLCDDRTAAHTEARHSVAIKQGLLDEKAYHPDVKVIRQTITVV
jgi:hypothetical protein